MVDKSENTHQATTGENLSLESEIVGRGKEPIPPRPKHPFVPGPIISKPDEVVLTEVPLPPARKE